MLTTIPVGKCITTDDENRVFNFFNLDNIPSKIMQMDANIVKHIQHIADINHSSNKKITRWYETSRLIILQTTLIQRLLDQ